LTRGSIFSYGNLRKPIFFQKWHVEKPCNYVVCFSKMGFSEAACRLRKMYINILYEYGIAGCSQVYRKTGDGHALHKKDIAGNTENIWKIEGV